MQRGRYVYMSVCLSPPKLRPEMGLSPVVFRVLALGLPGSLSQCSFAEAAPQFVVNVCPLLWSPSLLKGE